MKKKLLKVVLYTVLIGLSLIFLLPILYVFYNSLLPYRYVQTWAPVSVWTLDNFKELFTKYPIMRWYWNTFASTAIVVAGNLIFPTMAGYALAKLRFPGKKIIFGALLISMMVPFQLTMIQMYIQLARLNMHNTIWAITLPFLSQTMFLFMARQFFFAVPGELLEAARIDGCGDFKIFTKVILPVIKPAMASWASVTLIARWNDFFWPLLYLRKQAKYTLMVTISLLPVSEGLSTPWPVILAGTTLVIIPIIVMYLLLQTMQKGGSFAGAVKG